ncbi:MAG: hypothetical protein U0T83_02405 [Bacteriovoracaceae bacterium]
MSLRYVSVLLFYLALSLNFSKAVAEISPKEKLLIQSYYENELAIISNSKSNKNLVINEKFIEFLKTKIDDSHYAFRLLYLIKENPKYNEVAKNLDSFLINSLSNERTAKIAEEMISFAESRNLNPNGLSKDWINFLKERITQNKMSQSTIESLFEIRRRRTVPAYQAEEFRKGITDLLQKELLKNEIVADYIQNIANNTGRAHGFDNEIQIEAQKLMKSKRLPTNASDLINGIHSDRVSEHAFKIVESSPEQKRAVEMRLMASTGGRENELLKQAKSSFKHIVDLNKTTSLDQAITVIEEFYEFPKVKGHRMASSLASRLAELIEMKERMQTIDILVGSGHKDLVDRFSKIYKKNYRSTLPEIKAIADKIKLSMETIITEGLGVTLLPRGELALNKLTPGQQHIERFVFQIDHPFMNEILKNFMNVRVMNEAVEARLIETLAKYPSEKSVEFLREWAKNGNGFVKEKISLVLLDLAEKTKTTNARSCLRTYALEILQ